MTIGGQTITVSPSDPVCPGNRVIFTCQQSGTLIQWRINTDQMLRQTLRSTQVGSVITLGDHFRFHVVSNSSGILTTELQVTAVKELNNVTVDCTGSRAIIQVVSVGEILIAIFLYPSVIVAILQLLQVKS